MKFFWIAAAALVVVVLLLAPQPASAQQQCVDRKGNAYDCPSQQWQGQQQGQTVQQGQNQQYVACKDAYGRVIACPPVRKAETSRNYGYNPPAEWDPYIGAQRQEVPPYSEKQTKPQRKGYVDQEQYYR